MTDWAFYWIKADQLAKLGHTPKHVTAVNAEWFTCLLKKTWQLFFGKWIALPSPKRAYFWPAQPPGISKETHKI